MPLQLRDAPESWPVTRTEDFYRTDWVMALRLDELHAPGNDETFARLVLEHPGAVIVLAVDDRQRAYCLWQYRHPARRRLVELPAGLLDATGEAPEETARRELREEAGLEARHWTHLGSTWSSPGISSEVTHLFLARGLREITAAFERRHEEADMSGDWVPVDELRAAVLAGEVADGLLVQTLLLADAKGLL
ncbi:MAG TPA: NUDIX hydrolase [Nocardioides sp.]|uniref:NUDIX hydrolase n=1 Tax=Nocardioides sp. TaxID=35761 RepID=UPI002E3482D2|nr:NUDIX hydrolase [Nocardioides sp.]HEX3932599.1 NUDIX hydrolase [Nocardioides sp.]